MTEQLDFASIIERPPAYPDAPGCKSRGGTSEVAAEAITDRAKSIRQDVLALLSIRHLTADECAVKLGESILAVRPRLSELATKGLICDTGERRRNASGKPAIVWGVVCR